VLPLHPPPTPKRPNRGQALTPTPNYPISWPHPKTVRSTAAPSRTPPPAVMSHPTPARLINPPRPPNHCPPPAPTDAQAEWQQDPQPLPINPLAPPRLFLPPQQCPMPEGQCQGAPWVVPGGTGWHTKGVHANGAPPPNSLVAPDLPPLPLSGSPACYLKVGS